MLTAQIPNAITLMRIALVVPTAWLLWEGRYVQALVLMSVAGASDAVDGWLARRLDAVSRLGAVLDPVADKLLVAAMYVVFAIQGQLPLWLAVVVLGRDVVILLGAGAYRVLYGRIDIAPRLLSKANTALQIGVALLLLVHLCDFHVVSAVVGMLIDPYGFYLLALIGLASGIDYVVTWSVRAWREARVS